MEGQHQGSNRQELLNKSNQQRYGIVSYGLDLYSCPAELVTEWRKLAEDLGDADAPDNGLTNAECEAARQRAREFAAAHLHKIEAGFTFCDPRGAHQEKQQHQH